MLQLIVRQWQNYAIGTSCQWYKTVFSLTQPSNKLECCCYNRQKLKRDECSSLIAVNGEVKFSNVMGTSFQWYKIVFSLTLQANKLELLLQ
jgi:hypothetical protein